MNLTITPNLRALTITAVEALIARDGLLCLASAVGTINDRLDADDATACLRRLANFEREIEDARTAAKAPVLDISRKIDALGKELLTQISAERQRIARAVGFFEAGERRQAEDARAKMEIEARRIQMAAEKAAGVAAKLASNDVERDRACDAIIETAQAEVMIVRAQIAALPPKKAEGSKLLKAVKFEILDLDLFFKARPEFCTIEVNSSALRAVLKGSPNLQLPGLRHWIEESLSV